MTVVEDFRPCRGRPAAATLGTAAEWFEGWCSGVDFPDPETIRAVLGLADRAPSVHRPQPLYWRVDSERLQLYCESSPDGRAALLSGGAALHHCTVALAAMGWQARVQRLPDPDDREHLAMIEVIAQQPDELDVTLADSITRRHGDCRDYATGAVPWGDIALMGARAARAGVMLRQIDTDDRPAADDTVMVALGTQTDDELSRMRAGEVTSLVVLSATAMGLASCPSAELLDAPDVRETVRADVFGADGHPQMLVRIGRAASPRKTAVSHRE